jgi:hypothetical protein
MYKILIIAILTMLSIVFYSVNTLTKNIRAIHSNHITILEGASHD